MKTAFKPDLKTDLVYRKNSKYGESSLVTWFELVDLSCTLELIWVILEENQPLATCQIRINYGRTGLRFLNECWNFIE